MSDMYMRQRELVDVDKLRASSVAVIGCGSLGSHAALGLARVGVGRLSLFDDDLVSTINLPSQHFSASDVGKPKAEALATELERLAAVEIQRNVVRYGGGPIPPLVIVAVDSLIERRRIWEALRSQDVDVVVDGRMAGNVGRVLVVNTADRGARRRYAESLRGEPFEAPCTGRTVWPTVATVASLMVQGLTAWVSGQLPSPDLIVDLQLGFMTRGGGELCEAHAP